MQKYAGSRVCTALFWPLPQGSPPSVWCRPRLHPCSLVDLWPSILIVSGGVLVHSKGTTDGWRELAEQMQGRHVAAATEWHRRFGVAHAKVDPEEASDCLGDWKGRRSAADETFDVENGSCYFTDDI